MSFLTTIVFEIIYYAAILGYPAYQAYHANKENKIERIWILYFFIFGLFSLLEGTILYPVKALLNLIYCCTWCYVKFLLAVWLQHPSYRGALFLEQKLGSFLDLGYEKIAPMGSKVFSFVGVPNRSIE